MSGAVEYDSMRETLIDFAEWMGSPPSDAEWSAEAYLRECAEHTLSPATLASLITTTPPAEEAER